MSLLEDFKTFLRENLPTAPSFHPYYERALADMLIAGGKHFRAQLLLGVVNSLNPKFTKPAMRVALGVEMLHTYSLIHDDLPAMDNSDLRRGKPTLHITYDEVSAILAGDALNTQAFYEISRADLSAEVRIKCVEILSKNAGASGMVLGQAIDCFFESTPKARAIRQKFSIKKNKLNLDELKFLHIHKTAKLIAASLQMGAIIANLNNAECERIYDIGLDLGLVFQIADDLIDATQSADIALKPTGHDENKNSFTNLLGIDGAKRAKDELLSKIYAKLNLAPDGVKNVITNLIQKYLKG